MPNEPRCTAADGITAASRKRSDAQADVHELIRKQLLVLVGKLCAQLDRAGRGVDLVVDRPQLAFRELTRLRAIPRLDAQAVAATIRLQYRREDRFRAS